MVRAVPQNKMCRHCRHDWSILFHTDGTAYSSMLHLPPTQITVENKITEHEQLKPRQFAVSQNAVATVTIHTH